MALAASLLVACRQAPRDVDLRAVTVLSPVIPDAIDPYGDSRLIARAIHINVFEPLIRVRRSGDIVPALADSWTNPTRDVWLLRLRAGATFHDGTTASAPEVVASLERARQPGSSLAGAFSNIEEIAADGGAVTIRMKPGSNGPLLALSAVYVAKPSTSGGLVGTGPYRVLEVEPGSSVRVGRFGAFRGPAPLVEEAVFQKFGAGEAGAALLRRTRVPIVIDPSEAMVAAAREDPRLSVRHEPNGTVKYLAFRFDGSFPAFSDLRVRRAVQLALDLPELAAAEVGGGEPASQVVPTGTFGFDPARRPVRQDVDRARALLAEASLGNGLDVTLDVGESNRKVAERVVAQLSRAGIRVALRSFTSEEFHRRIEAESGFFLYSWFVGPDVTEPLKGYFHSRDEARALGVRNRTRYANRAVDEVIEAALQAPTAKARLPLLQKVGALLAEDLPWIPLHETRSFSIGEKALHVPARAEGPLVLSEIATAAGPR